MSAIRSLRAMPGAPHVWHVCGHHRGDRRRTSMCVYTPSAHANGARALAIAAFGDWLAVGAVVYVGEGVA